jgi:hypothetical protein
MKLIEIILNKDSRERREEMWEKDVVEFQLETK